MRDLFKLMAIIFWVGFLSSPLAGQNLITERTKRISSARPGSNMINIDDIKLMVYLNKNKSSMQGDFLLSAAIQNNGGMDIFINSDLLWNYGTLVFHVLDENGNDIYRDHINDPLLPLPARSDISGLIKLAQGDFFGNEHHFFVKDKFKNPGKYYIQVVYRSWFSKTYFTNTKLEKMPVLWREYPELQSIKVPFEVEP